MKLRNFELLKKVVESIQNNNTIKRSITNVELFEYNETVEAKINFEK